MCGFSGFYSVKYEEDARFRLINNMLKLIEHRGPDDKGVYIDKEICLGHQRLSIIDLKTGKQPMSKEGVTLVYNGEIYNYLDIKRDLIQRGYTFQTNSDTEVILQSYFVYGEAMFQYLDGMFALALWDDAHKKLLLSIDHIGIKPLYYTILDEQLIFSSELKSILAFPQIQKRINNETLCEYLQLSYHLSDESFLKGIFRITPGSFIIWRNGKLEKKVYWTPKARNIEFASFHECKEELRNTFQSSVQSHLLSDVEVGAYLSGGIDSSAIVATAKGSLDHFKTFSIGFPDNPNFDESEAAKAISNLYKTDHHFSTFTHKEVIDDLEKIVWHLDEPIAGAGVLPNYYVAKLASENVKVVLGGQGGDELFAGYARHLFFGSSENKFKLLLQMIGKKFGNHRSSGEQSQVSGNVHKQLNMHNLRGILKASSTFLKPFIERYYHHGGAFQDLESLLSSRDFISSSSNLSKLVKLDEQNQSLSHLNRMLLLDLQTYLRGYLHLEDRMSMAWSTESRVPFLSKKMIELALAIPEKWKINGLSTKYIFKESVSDLLPAEILNKRKMGFPVPVSDWFNNELKEYLHDIFLSAQFKNRGIFNHKYVIDLLQTPRLLQDRLWERKIWQILMVELWARQYLDVNEKLKF